MFSSPASLKPVSPEGSDEDESIDDPEHGAPLPPPGLPPAVRRPQSTRAARQPSQLASVATSKAAAVRFLIAVGFGEYAELCTDAEVSLITLSTMRVPDLERVFGCTPKKDAVALYEECLKLKHCLHRSSPAVDVPDWLPIILGAKPPTSRRKSALDAIRRPGHPAQSARPPRTRGGVSKEGPSAPAALAAPAGPTARGPVQLSGEERLRLMLCGVSAPDAKPRKDAANKPDLQATSVAEAARQDVLDKIAERERHLAALRDLLPMPQSAGARRRATRSLLYNTEVLQELRRVLAVHMSRLRTLGVEIHAAISKWKQTLRASFAYFSSLPVEQMAFFWEGKNYFLKMVSDLSFLPAPSQQDPLLLHWFSDQLPWVFGKHPGLSQLSSIELAAFHSPDPATLAAGAAAVGSRHRRLAEVQAALLEEAARNGSLLPTAELLPYVRERERENSGLRWQWSAMQVVLYGSECYPMLLRHLPEWFTMRRMTNAAVVVQQGYRQRIARKLARINRQAVQQHRREQRKKQKRDHAIAAAMIVSRWRGYRTRRAIREAIKANQNLDKRERTAREAEVQARKKRREMLKAREKASRCIQRRCRCFLARKAIQKLKEDNSLANRRAGDLMAQTAGVALLERVITRHRQTLGVMWGVFTQVCLAYEVPFLQVDEDRLRESTLYHQLQAAAYLREEEQQAAESKIETALHAMESARAADKKTAVLSSFGGGAKGGDDAELLEGPPRVDVLQRYEEARAEVRDTRTQMLKVQVEYRAWEGTRNQGKSPEPEQLKTMRDQRSAQALEAQRVLMQMVDCNEPPRLKMLSGTRHTGLTPAQTLEVLRGASKQLKVSQEWEVPPAQMVGQEGLLAEVTNEVSIAAAAAAGVEERQRNAREEHARREGALLPLIEMSRVRADLEQRRHMFKILESELKMNGVSLETRRLAAELHAASGSTLGTVAPPPGPHSRDAAEWQAFVDALPADFDNQQADIEGGRFSREHASKRELGELRERLKEKEAALKRVEELLADWLHTEGAIRIVSSLQAPERLRLKKLLLGKRADAYRRMCSTPVDARLVYKKMKRELRRITEAVALANELGSRPVQERTYTEGYLRLVVLREPNSTFHEIVASEEKQEDLASALALYMGEQREDRLYVRSTRALEVTIQYSSGASVEPGTEVVVVARREEADEKATDLLLRELVEANDAGMLSDVIGVRRDKVAEFVMVGSKEDVTDMPSLCDIREEMIEEEKRVTSMINGLSKAKGVHKAHARTWHRLNGALGYLKRLNAARVMEEYTKMEDGADDAPAEAPTGDAPTTAEGERAGLQAAGGAGGADTQGRARVKDAAKWLGVRDLVKARLLMLKAQRDKEDRDDLRNRLLRATGRLGLIHELQEAAMDWEPLYTTVAGNQIKVDVRWNMGLEELGVDDSAAKGRGSAAGGGGLSAEAERIKGRFCHFCASLKPPVRVQHRMIDCPKRRRANQREYTSDAMKRALAKLAVERNECEARLSRHKQADEAVREQKQHLLELAGAIKVLQTQEAHVKPPPPPPPPPSSERARAWAVFTRRRSHQVKQVMKVIARSSKREGAATGAVWAELKATALMTPLPQLLSAPLSPDDLKKAARSIEFDISPKGGDHMLIPVVIALARSPLPPNWRLRSEAGNELALCANDADAGDASSPLKLKTPPASPALGGSGAAADDTAYYEHALDGRISRAHPGAAMLLPVTRGMKQRAHRNLKLQPIDMWAQFAANESSTYFFHFRTGQRTANFPELDRSAMNPCVLPLRIPEPSAGILARSGAAVWPELEGEELIAHARAQLWEPRLRARAVHLWHDPCPLDVIISYGLYIGIDAAVCPELMWLVDPALSPELPVGWLRRSDFEDREYFWNSLTGQTQWEHPQSSFLAGVAQRLKPAVHTLRKGPRRGSTSR